MSPRTPQDAALLLPREVAELFGVGTSTIARWAREGKLAPILTPGGHRRYRLADVRTLGVSGVNVMPVRARTR
jgi:excisionase family DNA binding protein